LDLIVVDGVVMNNGLRGNSGNGLTLRDAKGEPVAANVGVSRSLTPDGARVEYIITTQNPKGAEPAKLVFSGSKRVTVDIPFTLKNVPLP
jgi:hypothetical protein